MNEIVLGAVLLCGGPLAAAPRAWAAGPTLLDVEVAVDGRAAPLYRAPDGSSRLYLEARRGSRYEVRLENRSGERLGVLLTVDGLNAISGERDEWSPGGPGRMYVLGPWEGTAVRGWRRSLDEVRLFTFVDEQASYAARSGKANPRLGWIEVAVYREKRPLVRQEPPRLSPPDGFRGDEARGQADTAGPSESPAPAARDSLLGRRQADAVAEKRLPERGSHPGTGWGRAERDPAVVVSFDPCPEPSERVTLRYEYARELRRLGVLSPWPGHDRLHERERGFAEPPPR